MARRKISRREKWDIHAAYHEAGHAVVAVVLTKDWLDSVSLFDPDAFIPAVRLNPAHSERQSVAINTRNDALEFWRVQFIIIIAGEIAGHRKYRKWDTASNLEIDRTRAHAAKLFLYLDLLRTSLDPKHTPRKAHRAEVNHLIKSWRTEAKALVLKHWVAIEAVATALIQRRRLSSGEVREIVNAHSITERQSRIEGAACPA